MKKAVIFGIGNNYHNYEKTLHEMFDIVAMIDNDANKYTGGGIQPVNFINDIDYDLVIITPIEYEEMYEQLLAMGVEKSKISLLISMPEILRSSILGYSYWGQHCDDLIIAAIFARIGIERPSYIDLGANFPIFYSNTYFLYRRGCRGITVEANPKLAKLIKIVRPEDTNLNIGVAVSEGTMKFYKFDETSGLNTFSMSEAEKWNIPIQEVIELPVTTLKNIVEKYCPSGFPDFLDCDIEGLDYDVLSDYDFTSSGPKVICVEVRKEDITKFDLMLKFKGYFRFCRMGENNIYVKNEYSRVLVHDEF